MRSHISGGRRACRDISAPRKPAGSVIIFGNRTSAPWLGSRSCHPGSVFPLARFSLLREGAVRARLWVIFTPPSAVGSGHRLDLPHSGTLRKSGADPRLIRYDYTGSRYFVNQRLKFVSVAAAVWSYRTLLFRRGNTFERRLSSQVC